MTTEETGIRPYGPGKFATILDSYVYQVSLEGGCDDETSSEYGAGWYGIMRHGRTIFRDHDPLLETLTAAEQLKLTSSAGVILHEASDGLVYVRYFASERALEESWQMITDDWESEEEEY